MGQLRMIKKKAVLSVISTQSTWVVKIFCNFIKFSQALMIILVNITISWTISLIWWFIDSFIILHHGKNKVLERKRLYLLAENLKIFPNIVLAELHHISQIHIGTCLHSSPNALRVGLERTNHCKQGLTTPFTDINSQKLNTNQ